MEFSLRMMLAARLPRQENFSRAAQWWFDSCCGSLYKNYFDRYRSTKRLISDSANFGDTQIIARFGPYSTSDKDMETIQYSSTWIDELKGALDHRPARTSLIAGRYYGNSRAFFCDAEVVTLNMKTSTGTRDSGWVQFSASFSEVVDDPVMRQELYDQWTDFLSTAMAEVEGDYGHIARHRVATEKSALECEIRKPTVYKRTQVLGDFCLRGY